MVRILKSESGKVTVELTLEELSAVENDLEVYIRDFDPYVETENAYVDPVTRELKAEIEAFWTENSG